MEELRDAFAKTPAMGALGLVSDFAARHPSQTELGRDLNFLAVGALEPSSMKDDPCSVNTDVFGLVSMLHLALRSGPQSSLLLMQSLTAIWKSVTQMTWFSPSWWMVHKPWNYQIVGSRVLSR